MRFLNLFFWLAAANAVTAPTAAQDILPDAPQEVQDFRLDTPPTPEPPPQSETPPLPPAIPSAADPPPIEAPPPSVVEPAESLSSPPPQSSLKPNITAPPAAAPTTANTDENLETAETQSLSADNNEGPVSVERAQADEESTLKDAQDDIADKETAAFANGVPEWILLAALVTALFILIIAFGLFKRRKTGEALANQKTEPPTIEAPSFTAKKQNITEAKPHIIAAPKKPKSQPELEMHFVPEKAMLSVANLTLCGELKIANIGKAIARNVQLYSGAICADEDHNAQIVNSFETAEKQSFQAIDNIRKGERLSVSIEIMLPNTEIKSFSVHGRIICAPIIMADIRYSGSEKTDKKTARLCAFIGPESTPPSEKIGPLRLDMGPRSFSPLGLRVIEA